MHTRYEEKHVFGDSALDSNFVFRNHDLSIVANGNGTVVHALNEEGLKEMYDLCPEDPTWQLLLKVYNLYNWRWRCKVPLFKMYPSDVRQTLKARWRQQTRRLHEDINPSKYFQNLK